MISDENYRQEEEEIRKIFEGTLDEAEGGAASEERINRIVERALFENVLKDTTSFVFRSFGAGITGLTGAVLGVSAGGSAEKEKGRDEKEELK